MYYLPVERAVGVGAVDVGGGATACCSVPAGSLMLELSIIFLINKVLFVVEESNEIYQQAIFWPTFFAPLRRVAWLRII